VPKGFEITKSAGGYIGAGAQIEVTPPPCDIVCIRYPCDCPMPVDIGGGAAGMPAVGAGA